jgi:hypothetical protein
MAQVDGKVVKVGDTVCFKSDFEQTGRIVKIVGDRLTLEARGDCGFGGDYIGGQDRTVEMARDCWID